MDTTPTEVQSEKCSLCGGFPDELNVNTGRDEIFPAAFGKLIPVGAEIIGQGHTLQLRRCPDCACYFVWEDCPQMYGSGNNAEEILTRLSPQASRLLHTFYAPEPNAPPAPAEVDEYFEAVPQYLLLEALECQVRKAPDAVTPFVPKLVSLLKANSTSFDSLLDAYASGSAKRAAEVEAARAQFAFSIMKRHFARAGVVMELNDPLALSVGYNDPPQDWSGFLTRFYLYIDDVLKRGGHAKLLTGLLAELVGFIRASCIDFTVELYKLLSPFSHRSWLEPFLPDLARERISDLEELEAEAEDEAERFRLGQLGY